MLAALRRLHDRVLQALDRNAETAGRLLQCAHPVRVPTSGHPRRVTTEMTTYYWTGKRWETCSLADGEE